MAWQCMRHQPVSGPSVPNYPKCRGRPRLPRRFRPAAISMPIPPSANRISTIARSGLCCLPSSIPSSTVPAMPQTSYTDVDQHLFKQVGHHGVVFGNHDLEHATLPFSNGMTARLVHRFDSGRSPSVVAINKQMRWPKSVSNPAISMDYHSCSGRSPTLLLPPHEGTGPPRTRASVRPACRTGNAEKQRTLMFPCHVDIHAQRLHRNSPQTEYAMFISKGH